MSIVYILQNGKKLDARHFLRYMEKKIKKTGKKLGVKQEKGIYCLDDAAIGIIFGLMTRKKSSIKKSAFLFCLKKELEIYAGLRKIKFNFIKYKGLKAEIEKMLDELEKRHKEIKYSILKAQLQAASLS
jgi:isocitrate/isopropylmalate dehydrogenase